MEKYFRNLISSLFKQTYIGSADLWTNNAPTTENSNNGHSSIWSKTFFSTTFILAFHSCSSLCTKHENLKDCNTREENSEKLEENLQGDQFLSKRKKCKFYHIPLPWLTLKDGSNNFDHLNRWLGMFQKIASPDEKRAISFCMGDIQGKRGAESVGSYELMDINRKKQKWLEFKSWEHSKENGEKKKREKTLLSSLNTYLRSTYAMEEERKKLTSDDEKTIEEQKEGEVLEPLWACQIEGGPKALTVTEVYMRTRSDSRFCLLTWVCIDQSTERVHLRQISKDPYETVFIRMLQECGSYSCHWR